MARGQEREGGPARKGSSSCEDVWDRLACRAIVWQGLDQNLKNIAENAEDPSHKAATLAVGPALRPPSPAVVHWLKESYEVGEVIGGACSIPWAGALKPPDCRPHRHGKEGNRQHLGCFVNGTRVVTCHCWSGNNSFEFESFFSAS